MCVRFFTLQVGTNPTVFWGKEWTTFSMPEQAFKTLNSQISLPGRTRCRFLNCLVKWFVVHLAMHPTVFLICFMLMIYYYFSNSDVCKRRHLSSLSHSSQIDRQWNCTSYFANDYAPNDSLTFHRLLGSGYLTIAYFNQQLGLANRQHSFQHNPFLFLTLRSNNVYMAGPLPAGSVAKHPQKVYYLQTNISLRCLQYQRT